MSEFLLIAKKHGQDVVVGKFSLTAQNDWHQTEESNGQLHIMQIGDTLEFKDGMGPTFESPIPKVGSAKPVDPYISAEFGIDEVKRIS